MSAPSRTDAQQRADDIRIFQRELDRLESEHVVSLSGEQKQALADHHERLLSQYTQDYDIDRDAQAKQLSLGMRIASFLGALALAASVFFLFYQFWGRLSTPWQVATLLFSALATFVATLWIQGRDETGYFAKLGAMVAFACFVLNISMLGQIFNITPSDKALIPWAALAFLLAYTCDLRLLLAAGILCMIAYVSARTGTWGGLYWLDFGRRPENFFPAAVLMFLLPQFVNHARFAGFAVVYRVFGLITLFLPALVLANWGQISYLMVDAGVVEGMYQLFGFVGCALAIWLGARRHWPEVVNTGLIFFVIFLYTKFFDWWWEIMPKYLFFLVLGLTAILFILVLRRLRTTNYKLLGGGAT
jgi:uncharacterized membrane protein